LVLLCWYFDHLSVFIRFIEIFDTSYLRDFAFGYDRIANGL